MAVQNECGICRFASFATEDTNWHGVNFVSHGPVELTNADIQVISSCWDKLFIFEGGHKDFDILAGEPRAADGSIEACCKFRFWLDEKLRE